MTRKCPKCGHHDFLVKADTLDTVRSQCTIEDDGSINYFGYNDEEVCERRKDWQMRCEKFKPDGMN